MKKTITVGRIKGERYGYKRSPKVTVDVELEDTKEGKALRICGEIWTPRLTNTVCDGQISDELREALAKHEFRELHVPEQTLQKLLDVWDRWHLNDLRTECEHQRELISRIKRERGEQFFYASADEVLTKVPELAKCPKCGYKFGSPCLFEPLPNDVIKFITQFCAVARGLMYRTRSEKSKKETILSVVFYPDLGLCVELGDEKIDDDDGIYGYGPTQGFIKALKKEIEFNVENAIGSLSEHPTLRKVHRRFRQGLDKYQKNCKGR